MIAPATQGTRPPSISPDSSRSVRRVGILALQGAFREHRQIFETLGAAAVELRTPQDLAGLDALVLPGGESTTMSLLLDSSGMYDPVAGLLRDGIPALATCAGLILLAREVDGGREDQRSFGVLDVTVLRNGYGRQIDSFEATIDVAGVDGPFTAVFIRAPRVTSVGEAAEVLATVDEQPVLVRQGDIVASTFHPELSGDLRLHQLFLGGA